MLLSINVTGEAYQHVAFLPWDEVFVEQRNTQSSRNTFLYTGKELDEMTGLYYYEQRYYDPNKSTFLGVDQLTDKGRGLSPYMYSFNNPILYKDPDGNWPWESSTIRQARLFARRTGGDFQKWRGQDGQRYASVTFGITSKKSKSSTKDENGNVRLAQTNSVAYTFRPGESRADLLRSVGVGFYKSMRASSSGKERLNWIGKSGDAWAEGRTSEYSRGGQAPGILKAVVGFNPLLSVPNAFSVLSKGEDIYGVNASTKMDRRLAVLSLAGSVVSGITDIPKLSLNKSNILKIGVGINTTVQVTNDSGLLEKLKTNLKMNNIKLPIIEIYTPKLFLIYRYVYLLYFLYLFALVIFINDKFLVNISLYVLLFLTVIAFIIKRPKIIPIGFVVFSYNKIVVNHKNEENIYLIAELDSVFFRYDSYSGKNIAFSLVVLSSGVNNELNFVYKGQDYNYKIHLERYEYYNLLKLILKKSKIKIVS